MATYRFTDRGAGMPYQAPGDAPFKRNVDVPALIANAIALENTSGTITALPSTGFGASDVLQIFRVPAGFYLVAVGVRVTTAEGGACTADIGNASATQTHLLAADADGYMGTIDLNSAVTQINLVGDAHLGYDNYPGVMFVTDGTIDFTFVTAATAVVVFDVWAVGWKCW